MHPFIVQPNQHGLMLYFACPHPHITSSPIHSSIQTTSLELHPTALRKLKSNSPTSQTVINGPISIKTVIDTAALLLIQNHLHGLRPVLLGADAAAHNLDRVHEVGEDLVMNGREGTGPGALLLLVCAGVDAALGAGEDPALSDEKDVAVGEFLLKFAGQAGWVLLVKDPFFFLRTGREWK